MKRIKVLAVVAGLVFGAALAAQAGGKAKKVTLTGTVACAKCVLGEADAKDCQDVLLVDEKQYYLVKNEVTEKSGHACQSEKAVTVTGTVAKKDGKMWLTATKMEAVEKS